MLNPLDADSSQLPKPDRTLTWYSDPQGDLQVHVFGASLSDGLRPAVIFFFGGAWKDGHPKQFFPQCDHLRQRGIVAISAQYRTKTSHGVTPFECIDDAKRAYAYVRAHAQELGIDTARLGLGGGSAGGHLAAAVACATRGDESPGALVLFNPVIDNGPGGYGHDRIGDRWSEFSPMANLHEGMPPTVVMLGTEDKLIPVATMEEFQNRLQKLGVRCDLHLHEGQPHGFFNTARYQEALTQMDEFLVSLGWLKPRF